MNCTVTSRSFTWDPSYAVPVLVTQISENIVIYEL